jgi:hypothetical protein
VARDEAIEHSFHDSGTCELAQANEVQYGAPARDKAEFEQTMKSLENLKSEIRNIRVDESLVRFDISDFGFEILPVPKANVPAE